jgi:hypothetical protein
MRVAMGRSAMNGKIFRGFVVPQGFNLQNSTFLVRLPELSAYLAFRQL